MMLLFNNHTVTSVPNIILGVSSGIYTALMNDRQMVQPIIPNQRIVGEYNTHAYTNTHTTQRYVVINLLRVLLVVLHYTFLFTRLMICSGNHTYLRIIILRSNH